MNLARSTSNLVKLGIRKLWQVTSMQVSGASGLAGGAAMFLATGDSLSTGGFLVMTGNITGLGGEWALTQLSNIKIDATHLYDMKYGRFLRPENHATTVARWALTHVSKIKIDTTHWPETKYGQFMRPENRATTVARLTSAQNTIASFCFGLYWWQGGPASAAIIGACAFAGGAATFLPNKPGLLNNRFLAAVFYTATSSAKWLLAANMQSPGVAMAALFSTISSVTFGGPELKKNLPIEALFKMCKIECGFRRFKDKQAEILPPTPEQAPAFEVSGGGFLKRLDA